MNLKAMMMFPSPLTKMAVSSRLWLFGSGKQEEAREIIEDKKKELEEEEKYEALEYLTESYEEYKELLELVDEQPDE